MSLEDREDTTICKAVVNHEDQHSIWPASRAIPAGWREAGKTGSRAECLDWIKAVWTAMRPRSQRKKRIGIMCALWRRGMDGPMAAAVDRAPPGTRCH